MPIADNSLREAMSSSSLTPRTTPTAYPVVNATAEGVFRREGDFWTVAYEGVVVRLRDAKGMHYLAQLLARPWERISAAALSAGVTSSDAAPTDSEHARVAVTKRIRGTIQRINAHHPALGYHLATAIKTGHTCGYLPDPQRPVVWSVR